MVVSAAPIAAASVVLAATVHDRLLHRPSVAAILAGVICVVVAQPPFPRESPPLHDAEAAVVPLLAAHDGPRRVASAADGRDQKISARS